MFTAHSSSESQESSSHWDKKAFVFCNSVRLAGLAVEIHVAPPPGQWTHSRRTELGVSRAKSMTAEQEIGYRLLFLSGSCCWKAKNSHHHCSLQTPAIHSVAAECRPPLHFPHPPWLPKQWHCYGSYVCQACVSNLRVRGSSSTICACWCMKMRTVTIAVVQVIFLITVSSSLSYVSEVFLRAAEFSFKLLSEEIRNPSMSKLDFSIPFLCKPI